MVIGKVRSSEMVVGALKQAYDCVYPTIVLRMKCVKVIVVTPKSEGGTLVHTSQLKSTPGMIAQPEFACVPTIPTITPATRSDDVNIQK